MWHLHHERLGGEAYWQERFYAQMNGVCLMVRPRALLRYVVSSMPRQDVGSQVLAVLRRKSFLVETSASSRTVEAQWQLLKFSSVLSA